MRSRIRRAERSESTGNSAAKPSSTLLRSMPALAHTKPCSVSEMIRSPRRRSTRTDSASTSGLWLVGSSGSTGASRPSALDTIFWVTTTQSRSCSPSGPAAATMSPARSSPGRISPMPSMPRISRLTTARPCRGSQGSWCAVHAEDLQAHGATAATVRRARSAAAFGEDMIVGATTGRTPASATAGARSASTSSITRAPTTSR